MDSDRFNVSIYAAEDLFCMKDLGQQGTCTVLNLAVPREQETFFRTKTELTFGKMFSAFCEKYGLAPKSVVFRTQGGKRIHPLDVCSSIVPEHGDQLMVYHHEHFVIAPKNRIDAVGADLVKMLFNEHLSDVILEVGPECERICAHRCILASRSPKFAGLFSGQFSESSAAETKLPAQEPRTFKLLLSYLYTNKVEMPSATAAVMALLVMADEYLCGALKKLCEEELLERLSLENVCEMFCAATLHGLQELVEISGGLSSATFTTFRTRVSSCSNRSRICFLKSLDPE